MQESGLIIETIACMIPGILSMSLEEDDIGFLTDIYIRYRNLMRFIARQYFDDDYHEIEEVISETAIRMCEYVNDIKGRNDKHITNYVLKITRNVCRVHLRRIGKNQKADSTIAEYYSNTEAERSQSVFANVTGRELLDSYSLLSDHDKELIRMRYVDQMRISDIAHYYQMSENAVRVAISRAKNRLLKSASEVREGK